MTSSNIFALFLTCLFVTTNGQKKTKSFSSIQEKGKGFLSVIIGENITLECSYEDDNLVQIYWYKQSLGQKPKIMSSFYGYTLQETFYKEFENNPRFELDTKNQNHHLKIFNLQFSDSATYQCISFDSYSITFLEGYIVHVKDASSYIQTSVDQSSSENIHAGDSVTLNCTVHTGSCDGEHRVYWFKDSEDSHPGLIYTDGGRNDQCERNNNTQTQSCVYELSMKNITESHAGIYYCAVVSCGHILFGNGSKLEFTAQEWSLLSLMYFLNGVLTVSLIFLTSYIIHTAKICKSKEETSAAPSLTRSKDEGHHCDSGLKRSTMMEMDDTWSQCVYFTTEQHS